MQRLALCIGSGRFEPSVYHWTDRYPDGPAEDANAFAAELRVRGSYDTEVMDHPRMGDVLNRLSVILPTLRPSDEFLFYYSGHGGRMRTPMSVPAELPRTTNVLCLRDGLVLDAELGAWWPAVSAGVRMTAIMDCCYAATSPFAVKDSIKVLAEELSTRTTRAAPDEVIARVVAAQREALAARYERAHHVRSTLPSPMPATLMVLGACQDNELAYAYRGRGAYTRALATVMSMSVSQRNTFERLNGQLVHALAGQQTPELTQLGAAPSSAAPIFA